MIRGAILLVVLLTFAAALAGYASLAAPTVMFGDSAELQTVALAGGIPHATGYPAFVLLGRLFARLPFSDHAFRITFMSCCFGAATVALFVLAFTALDLSIPSALAGALALGASFTFWRSSLRAEVYTLGVFLGLLALWRTLAALRVSRRAPTLLAGFLCGLALTGHLSFILPVAILGLTLAWHTARFQRPVIPSLTLLLVVFLLGLTPYLYLVWADTRHYAYDYLRLVDLVHSPSGARIPGFTSPWERVAWLVTGRNRFPVIPFAFDPEATARNLLRSGTLLFLFELGPLALPFVLLGMFRGLLGEPRTAIPLVLTGASSLLFTAAIAGGGMTHLFLLPCALVCVVFLAAGIEPLLARRRVTGILVLLGVLLAPHLARIYADRQPIGPWGLRVEEEDPTLARTLLPSLRGFDTPRVYGEQALAAIPRGALVVANWPELTNLFYFQVVEGQRPDLTLSPTDGETLVQRLEGWQRSHAVSEAPFVFLSRPLDLPEAGAALDSLQLPLGRWIYVRRAPLMSAP